MSNIPCIMILTSICKLRFIEHAGSCRLGNLCSTCCAQEAVSERQSHTLMLPLPSPSRPQLYMPLHQHSHRVAQQKQHLLLRHLSHRLCTAMFQSVTCGHGCCDVLVCGNGDGVIDAHWHGAADARKKDIPIVQLNPGGTLNHKYTGETAVRSSGLPYSVIRSTGKQLLSIPISPCLVLMPHVHALVAPPKLF